MQLRSFLSAACAAMAFSSFAAGAAGMAPGLWEQNMKFKSQSGEMEKSMADMQAQMAALPPDQRKMAEQMMAKRGMSFGAQGTTVQVCVTKEQAERMEPLPMSKEECKQDVVSRSSSSMKVKWVCSGKDPSKGEGEIHFSSDKAFAGHAAVDSVRNGKPDHMEVESIGKWLSADCGAVKPRNPGKS
jgi:hypothetical protein